MVTIITILHILICLLLILIVLLQAGKGSDIGSAFGGGASQTLFGTGGSKTVFSKITTILAILFMITSFLLATLPSQKKVSDIQKELQKEETSTNQGVQQQAIPSTQDTQTKPATETPKVPQTPVPASNEKPKQ
jgi:preprotein translocase subunit SecG